MNDLTSVGIADLQPFARPPTWLSSPTLMPTPTRRRGAVRRATGRALGIRGSVNAIMAARPSEILVRASLYQRM